MCEFMCENALIGVRDLRESVFAIYVEPVYLRCVRIVCGF